MSSGGLVGMVVNFIVFSALSSTLGFAIDIIIKVTNASNAMNMDALNTISNLHLIYIAGPFLYILALGINYIVTSNSEASGEV
jgi:hypothetical protein